MLPSLCLLRDDPRCSIWQRTIRQQKMKQAGKELEKHAFLLQTACQVLPSPGLAEASSTHIFSLPSCEHHPSWTATCSIILQELLRAHT